MGNNNSNKIERKKFFKAIGLGALGVSLSSLFPVRLFGDRKQGVKKVSVKVHPFAVKRNN